jgi:hypothetical protein
LYSRDFAFDEAEMMVDSGAVPNLLKLSFLKNPQLINREITTLIKGIGNGATVTSGALLLGARKFFFFLEPQ